MYIISDCFSVQLKESQKQSDSSEDLIQSLEGERFFDISFCSPVGERLFDIPFCLRVGGKLFDISLYLSVGERFFSIPFCLPVCR